MNFPLIVISSWLRVFPVWIFLHTGLQCWSPCEKSTDLRIAQRTDGIAKWSGEHEVLKPACSLQPADLVLSSLYVRTSSTVGRTAGRHEVWTVVCAQGKDHWSSLDPSRNSGIYPSDGELVSEASCLVDQSLADAATCRTAVIPAPRQNEILKHCAV